MKGPIVDIERAHKAAMALDKMFGGGLKSEPAACADVEQFKEAGAILWDHLTRDERESLCHLALAFMQGVQSREIFVQVKAPEFKTVGSLAEMEKILALHGAMSAVPILACVLAFRLTEEKE